MNRMILPAITAGLCFAMAVPDLNASVWNQKTIMTFKQPVEIPGKTLSPGSYVFKLENNMGDRDVVQVYTRNMKQLVGTYLTVPDYRKKAPGKTIVNFRERAEGSPEAIKPWFYPGDNYGHEFVYHKNEAMKLAKANNEPVPYLDDNDYSDSRLSTAHVRTLKPGGEEVEVIEIFGPVPQTTSSNAQGQQKYGNAQDHGNGSRSYASQSYNNPKGSSNQGNAATSQR